MNDQTLDQFLAERTAKAMKRIEEEIFAEVSEGICTFFGADTLSVSPKTKLRKSVTLKRLEIRASSSWDTASS